MIAVFPGSFDPFTYGHLYLLKDIASCFSNVCLAVAEDSNKKTTFSADERISILNQYKIQFKDIFFNVEILKYSGLTIDLVNNKKSFIIARGVRNIHDFIYEKNLNDINKTLSKNKIKTVFFPCNEDSSSISSTNLKDIISLGGDASCFAPEFVVKAIKNKLL